MNNAYVERAKKQVKDPKVLSVVASRRAAQLARGAKATVKCKDENYLDIALLEIAEGHVIPAFEEESNEDGFVINTPDGSSTGSIL